MLRRVKVLVFERAVVFRLERFVRILEPGIHWVTGRVTRVDMRRQDLPVDFGPVFTHDGVPVGVEARIAFRIADPERALRRVDRPERHLLVDAAAAVVRTVSNVRMDELAPAHNRMEFDIQDRLDLEASTYGVRIEDVLVLRIRYPRAVRRRMKRNEAPGLG